MKIPIDLEPNKEKRAWFRREGAKSVGLQQELIGRCAEDIRFWINGFVWQFNPASLGDNSTRFGPFILWDFQEEMLEVAEDCRKRGKDLVILKSREMGASWLCLLLMDWHFLFHRGMRFLVVSKDSDAVFQPGDSDSLFWKLDFVHEHLPRWMLGETKRRKFTFNSVRTGSSIVGEASTGKAGVGGRADLMFIDEFSLIKEDYEVLHHTANTAPCRIFNGTHRGMGTAFHELTQRVDYRKIVMHWSQHPDKRKGLYRFDEARNRVEMVDTQYEWPADLEPQKTVMPAGGPFPGLRSPYYDEQCVKQGSPRAVAMNLDIDAGGSVAQFFNPLTIRALRNEYACEPFWEGHLSYDRDTGKAPVLVPAKGGPLKFWLHPDHHGQLPSGRYGAGADLSTGIGSTNSVVSIISADTCEKVGEYATANILPENFAGLVSALLWMFKNEYGEPPRFAWENAGPGLVFGKRLLELGYRAIHYREAHQTLAGGKVSDRPGWYPSPEQKRMLLEDYRAALEARTLINHSDVSLEECLPYRYTASNNVEHPKDLPGDDVTGARVNHGDRVIADALAWKMVQYLGARGAQAEPEPPTHPGTFAGRKRMALAANQSKPWSQR